MSWFYCRNPQKQCRTFRENVHMYFLSSVLIHKHIQLNEYLCSYRHSSNTKADPHFCVRRVAVEAEVLFGNSVQNRMVWLCCYWHFDCHPQLFHGPQCNKDVERYTHAHTHTIQSQWELKWLMFFLISPAAHQWLYTRLEGNSLLQFFCWTLYPSCLCAVASSFSHNICPFSTGLSDNTII